MDYMIEQILHLIKAFKGIENERRQLLTSRCRRECKGTTAITCFVGVIRPKRFQFGSILTTRKLRGPILHFIQARQGKRRCSSEAFMGKIGLVD